MPYTEAILSARNNPGRLENIYKAARQEQRLAEFTTSLQSCYQKEPDNLLYAAWSYRLQQAAGQLSRSVINWKLAVPLAVGLSLIFWVLSLDRLDLNFADRVPYLVQIWSLIAASFVIAFVTFTARRHHKRALGVFIGFLFFGAYAMLFSILPDDRNYQTLMAAHLPLLAWIGAGLAVLGRQAGPSNRFAFLIKSIEVFVVGGIYLIGGVAFGALTYGLFQTIDVSIPEPVQKLLFPGGAGLIILLAAASTYDPLLKPVAQNFSQGLSKLVSTLMRLLMPLALLVLVIFSYFILQPENFWIPFNNRDALITYNAVLFAIVFLLVGAIPMFPDDLSARTQVLLRIGIIGVAILTVLVSLYAMSATVYRTFLGTITMNRMAVIGWNTINIGILLLLIYRLWRSGRSDWIQAGQAAFSRGMLAYILWTIFVILSVPFIFGPGLATGWSKPAPAGVTPVLEVTAAPEGSAATVEPTTPARAGPTPSPASLTSLPSGCPPACTSLDLAGAYLPEVDLRNADLSGTNLQGADLQQANLRRANLAGTDLDGADLRGANLAGATLHDAGIDANTQLDEKWHLVWQIVNQGAVRRDLRGRNADLSQTNLQGAKLAGADLSFVSLAAADLRGADLSGANLNNVSLHQTIINEDTRLDDKERLVWEIVNQGGNRRDLSGVNLSQANLADADLSQANLSRAVLTDTNLSGASLYGADLRGAILTEADPQGGSPRQAMLEEADLAGVRLDDTTQIEDKWRLVWEIVNEGAKNRDLSGADLAGADLHAVDLSGATLIGARLNRANLQHANLSGADLNGAFLQNADLTGANLAGANLFEAHLVGVKLPADLGGANFRKTNLQGANLQGANLSGLNLSRTNLQEANLAEADLSQADLSEAHLEGAYLWRANLSQANLRGAYLKGTYLWEANLDGVDLTGAELTQTVMADGTIHE
jgi:uncharacterized protein YjbI with pentapeptide repeats